jgi:hypothetical protein
MSATPYDLKRFIDDLRTITRSSSDIYAGPITASSWPN